MAHHPLLAHRDPKPRRRRRATPRTLPRLAEALAASLLLGIVLLLSAALVVGCTFDAGSLAQKTDCRYDEDCRDGLVCACALVCVEPQFVEPTCDELLDAGGGDGSSGLLDAGETNNGGGGDGGGGDGGSGDGGGPRDTGVDSGEPPDTGEPPADTGPDPDVPTECDAPNACGGCAALEGQPGEPCGQCTNGIWSCTGINQVSCQGDVVNACGGCTGLSVQPGSACGECSGEVVCVGTEQVTCRGGERNACGGCDDLGTDPGEPCGACDGDSWVCDGTTLQCEFASRNACNGCPTLNGAPGDPCGLCGTGTMACTPDGGALTCDDPGGLNACGGCEQLPNAPGGPCGECGTGAFICQTENTTICQGGHRNVCGGCVELEGGVGDMCGCGRETQICDGADAMLCLDNYAQPNTPVDLGSYSDTTGWEEREEVLHNASDEDWFVAEARDGLGELTPGVDLNAPVDLALCAYYTWDNHDDLVPNCDQGTPSQYGALQGCCSDTPSNNEVIRMTDTDDFFRTDRGTLYIRVFSSSGAASCQPYQIRFIF